MYAIPPEETKTAASTHITLILIFLRCSDYLFSLLNQFLLHSPQVNTGEAKQLFTFLTYVLEVCNVFTVLLYKRGEKCFHISKTFLGVMRCFKIYDMCQTYSIISYFRHKSRSYAM